VDLLKVTVKHHYGESKEISESAYVCLSQPYYVHVEGYSENGFKREINEEQLQLREYNEEKVVSNHHRTRSALPLGSHELFHRRVHPDQTRTRPHTADSLPDGPFMSPTNRHQTHDIHQVLPKLARNTATMSPGPPQPPKVAFLDATGISSEQHNIVAPCLHLFSFCHYCGRSSGVRLAWCLHCRNAIYCSQSCRQSHWDEGHKTECTDPNILKMHKRCE